MHEIFSSTIEEKNPGIILNFSIVEPEQNRKNGFDLGCLVGLLIDHAIQKKNKIQATSRNSPNGR